MAASRNSPPADLSRRVAEFFASRLPRGRRVCVALSGGRDSVALLHALAEARTGLPRLQLSALHVHHGLSANADAWAAFCGDLCRRLDLPLEVRRVQVVDGGEGLEAAARHARYTAFAGCDADWLVLAHHRDDQAETLLLNLLRGAASEGLAAMPEERPLAPGSALRLVRPLLGTDRRCIEEWLRVRAQGWIEDESNADSRLRRNFLRHEVLPRLASVFPAPAAALARSAALLAEQAELLDALAASDGETVVDGAGLRLTALNALPPARRANLLRRELRRRGWRMPDARYLREIVRQLVVVSPGAAPRFELEGGELRVHRGILRFCPVPAVPPASPQPWHGEDRLPWGGGVLSFVEAERPGLGLARARLQAGPVSIRRRQGGEALQPDPRRPRRSLKKLLQEAGVPPWLRGDLPLLFCGDRLAWVAGIGADAAFAAAADETGLLPVWAPPSAEASPLAPPSVASGTV